MEVRVCQGGSIQCRLRKWKLGGRKADSSTLVTFFLRQVDLFKTVNYMSHFASIAMIKRRPNTAWEGNGLFGLPVSITVYHEGKGARAGTGRQAWGQRPFRRAAYWLASSILPSLLLNHPEPSV